MVLAIHIAYFNLFYKIIKFLKNSFQIWSYLVDLLLAVQHLHDHDLIHMDIKPENIFIGMDGICKLGDFGLVIDLAKMDSSKAVEGDPR